MKPGISDGSETARAQSSYEPLTFVNVELHGAFIPHFQQQRLASFLTWDIRTLHYLKDLMRLFAQCTQDFIPISEHFIPLQLLRYFSFINVVHLAAATGFHADRNALW
jgi:hypothetical protein